MLDRAVKVSTNVRARKPSSREQHQHNCQQNAKDKLPGEKPAQKNSHRIEEKEHSSKQTPRSQADDLETRDQSLMQTV
jgi:hypothetical protein